MSRTGRRPLNPRYHKLEEATVRFYEEQELTVHPQNHKLPKIKELNFQATYICVGHDQCPPN